MIKYMLFCSLFIGGFYWGWKKNPVSYVSISLIYLLFMAGLNLNGAGLSLDGAYLVDSVSIFLIMLSILVSLLMIYSSYSVMRFSEHYLWFYGLIYFLMWVLLITFVVGDLLMFYYFFEISLVPTLLIIIGWGYQPERLQAGVYFIFYTLFASLPLLMFIVNYNNLVGGLYMAGLMTGGFNGGSGVIYFILGLISFLAFLVKLPMYLSHLWLPSAHVEAPVAGSMILAGVLLKLGGYGMMRVLWFNFIFFSGGLSSYIIGLSLVGMFCVGLVCCRLNDISALVAYSSVAHMALVISGLLSMFCWGWLGAFVMMVAHGLSSSGLFCLVNMYYERTMSRSFYINSGLLMGFPIFSLMMFFLAAANIAAPPTVNLASEIFLMVSILGFDYAMLILFPLGSFFGAVFTLFMFSYSQHGLMYMFMYGFGFSNFREFHILLFHIVPLNALILNLGLFTV